MLPFDLGDGWVWRLSTVGLDCKPQSNSGDFDLLWPALVRDRLGDVRRPDEDEACQGRRTRDLIDVRKPARGSEWFWEFLHCFEEAIILRNMRWFGK